MDNSLLAVRDINHKYIVVEWRIIMYDEAVVQYFLEHQMQLFKENVAESPEEAEEFLEDCMAVVCKNIKEVRAYFEDEGADIAGMSNADLAEAEEVFAIPDGRYLIVEA